MDNYHVTKKGEKWNLTKEGAQRVSKSAETKRDIIDKTREYMKDKTGSVKIHKESGGIQEERTYQRRDDPSRTKG